MEISSTINERWRSLTLASFIACIIFIFFINQNHQSSTLFISTNSTMATFSLKQQEEQEPTLFVSTNSTIANLTMELESVSYNTNVTNQVGPSSINSTISNKAIKQKSKSVKKCDINEGKWVYKAEAKPSYKASNCPFVEEKMNCIGNGRPDSDYENWIWKPNDCDFVQFNGTDMLERLRGKRMIIVGDSMNRNQWESLACLLYSCVNPSQVEGIKLKSKNQKLFRAKAYNFELEFDFSPFLVNLDEKHKSGSRVLQLDKISATASHWLDADIMVFNTGHWWAHIGKFKRWDLYDLRGKLLEKMKIKTAFLTGMRTWAKWIDQNVNPNRTTVLFRSISPQHHGDYWCYNVKKPIMNESYETSYPDALVDIMKNTIRKMRTPVRYLNVTKLSQYRIDAHQGLYRNTNWKVVFERYKRHIPSFVDCSHWCLPGVPDTWNRVLYASLFSDGFSEFKESVLV